MANWTRNTKVECFNHVFKNVFKCEDKDPLMQVYKGTARDIEKVLRDTFEEMALLEYESDDGSGKKVRKPLLRHDYRTLQVFKAWAVVSRANGTYPLQDLSKWKELTNEDFVLFSLSTDCNCLMEDPSMFKSYKSPTATVASTPPTYSPADMFKKGIKRDKSSFPILKRDADWADFKGSMMIEAHAQGVEKVFDASYTPISPDAKALFLEQKKFVLSVLGFCMKTQNGKAIVRKHHDDMDAQAAWAEICTVYEASVHATVEAADLLSYITTTRLGDGTWRSGCEDFIIHWEKQCDDYDNLCEAGEELGKGQRKTMLQNAVAAIDDLRAVKVTQDQLRINNPLSGKPSADEDYSNYLALLKSAAIGYDKKHEKFGKAKKQQVYGTDLEYFCGDGYDENAHAPSHDIDTPVSHLLQVSRADVRTFLPHSIFNSFSQEDKEHWFKIGKEARVQIVEALTKLNSGSTRPARSPHLGRGKFQ